MNYIRVRWLHELPDEPVWLVSELNGDRWETRKVEIFPDGSKAYASSGETVGRTRLGLEPVPSLDAIAVDPQFIPEAITKGEFEKVWHARTAGR